MKCRETPEFFSQDQDDIYSVSEITDAIRQNLESEFHDISVLGEIANFKAHSSGHIYFSLRDENNLIRAVVFRRRVTELSFGPENGDSVIAKGRISHYGGSGQTQLIVRNMVQAGRGKMELDFRRLVGKLMDEGLTSPQRKRSIPAYPHRIVVITSPTGAVIRDITETLGRRWPVAEIVHIPTKVQGDGAEISIVEAFNAANRIESADVVILARGGGSVEDLWTFNSEEVARAVASSAYPVITGVGHEVDKTVVDFVSDLCAATPTAAAELAAPSITEVRRVLSEHLSRIKKLYADSSENRLIMLEYMLRSSAFPALGHRLEQAELMLDDRRVRLDEWWERKREGGKNEISGVMVSLERALEKRARSCESQLSRKIGRFLYENPGKRVSAAKEALGRLLRITGIRTETSISMRRRDLSAKLRALDGLHPLRVLRRGYTYCTTVDDEIVLKSAKSVESGGGMVVNFYDGGLLCRVERERKGKVWQEK